MLLHEAVWHVGVAVDVGATEPPLLPRAGCRDPGTDPRRLLPGRPALELIAGEPRHLHLDVYPVHQGAGHSGVVAVDVRRGARTVVLRVAVISTGAGIHRGHQAEPRGVRHRHHRTDYRDLPVLERAAQRLERAPVEERHLVEVEDAAVGKRDLAGSR